MGIRIYKCLGWGLSNIISKDHLIKDPRFSQKVIDRLFDDGGDPLLEEFMDWVSNPDNDDEIGNVLCRADGHNYKKLLATSKSLRWMLDYNLTQKCKEWKTHKRKVLKEQREHLFFHDGEYGLPNVGIFVPIWNPDYYRWDDTIDYHEADATPRNRVKDITNRCGIYPYINMYRIPGAKHFDKNNKKQSPKRLEPSVYNQLVGRWDKKIKPIAEKEYLEYLLRRYRPAIHPSVLLFTYQSGIFKNWTKTVHQLRPMIYTYWG